MRSAPSAIDKQSYAIHHKTALHLPDCLNARARREHEQRRLRRAEAPLYPIAGEVRPAHREITIRAEKK